MAQPIDNYQPQTGRLLKEDSTLFNIADYYSWQQSYDVKYETIFNGALILTSVITATQETDTYIGISVPEGKELVLFDSSILLNNGTFLISKYNGVFTDGTPFLRNPLRFGQFVDFDSTFNVGVAPSGTQTLVEQAVITTSTNSGSKAEFGGTSNAHVFKILPNGTNYVVRIQRLSGSGAYNVGLEWICWESSDG